MKDVIIALVSLIIVIMFFISEEDKNKPA